MRLALILSLGVLALLPFYTQAQEPRANPYKTAGDIPYVLLGFMSYPVPVTKEEYIKKQLYIISREGRNPGMLDITDYVIRSENYKKANGPAFATHKYKDIRKYVSLNPDGDEKLTAGELARLAGYAFDIVDTNKDDIISEQESTEIKPIKDKLEIENIKRDVAWSSCPKMKGAIKKKECLKNHGIESGIEVIAVFIGSKRVYLEFTNSNDKNEFRERVKPWARSFVEKDLVYLSASSENPESIKSIGITSINMNDFPWSDLVWPAYNPDKTEPFAVLIGKDGLIKKTWTRQPDLKEVFGQVDKLIQAEHPKIYTASSV